MPTMDEAAEEKIFDRFFVVSLPLAEGTADSKAEIVYSFPQDCPNDQIYHAVPVFCFPEDGKTLRQQTTAPSDTFSFVLTGPDGTKQHGYCRRIFSPASIDCCCILSTRPSFNLFSQILDLVEEKRNADLECVSALLEAIDQEPFPAPGHSIELAIVSDDDQLLTHILSRPPGNDYLLDYISFWTLFNQLSVAHVLELFSCLLGERRVILVADDLATLSACATAVCALLNPFCWQHVFIPVLPNTLLDYCCAPMPFLVGITSESMARVKRLPMEEVYMLNLSSGEWELNPDLPPLVPPALSASLGRSLGEISHLAADSEGGRKRFDVSVARRFKYFIYSLLGTYADHLLPDGTFDREAFVANARDDVHRQFVDRFTAMQMFQQFLQERMAMSRNGNLRSCSLLKVARQSRSSMRISPTELLFCSKCNNPLDATFETVHGKPLCPRCAEKKKRMTWKGFKDTSSRWGAGLFQKRDNAPVCEEPVYRTEDSLSAVTRTRRGGREREVEEEAEVAEEAEEVMVQESQVQHVQAYKVHSAQATRVVQVAKAQPSGSRLLQTSRLAAAPQSPSSPKAPPVPEIDGRRRALTASRALVGEVQKVQLHKVESRTLRTSTMSAAPSPPMPRPQVPLPSHRKTRSPPVVQPRQPDAAAKRPAHPMAPGQKRPGGSQRSGSQVDMESQLAASMLSGGGRGQGTGLGSPRGARGGRGRGRGRGSPRGRGGSRRERRRSRGGFRGRGRNRLPPGAAGGTMGAPAKRPVVLSRSVPMSSSKCMAVPRPVSGSAPPTQQLGTRPMLRRPTVERSQSSDALARAKMRPKAAGPLRASACSAADATKPPRRWPEVKPTVRMQFE